MMRPPRTLLLAVALAPAIAPTPATASARERFAVFFVVDGDPETADNLAEVVISWLASEREYETVGLRELRKQIGPLAAPRAFSACLEEPRCLSQLGTAAGAARAVIGHVRRQDERFDLSLGLADLRTGVRETPITRHVPARIGALIIAVREATAASFVVVAPRALSPPPPPPAGLATRSGTEDRPTALREGAPSKLYLTYGAAAMALTSFAAAAVTGSIAEGTPMGATRAEIQDDVGRRDRYAFAANSLWVAGILLVGTTAAAWLWHRSSP